MMRLVRSLLTFGLVATSQVSSLPLSLAHPTQLKEVILLKRAPVQNPGRRPIIIEPLQDYQLATHSQKASSHIRVSGIHLYSAITAPIVIPAAAAISTGTNLVNTVKHTVNGNYGHAAETFARGVAIKPLDTAVHLALGMATHLSVAGHHGVVAAHSLYKAKAGQRNRDVHSQDTLQMVKDRPDDHLQGIWGYIQETTRGHDVGGQRQYEQRR